MSYGLSKGRSLEFGGVGLTRDDLPDFDSSRPEAARFDLREWFPSPERRFELEIGSGKGTFLVQQAVLEPKTNFLGVEWAREFFKYAADRARRHALANVRLLHTDASEFVRFHVPDASVDVVHLYFSDPWPKKRHHKRRVVQDRALEDFHRIIVPGGHLHLVTDHDDLWAWYEEHASRATHLFERRPFEAPASASEGEVVGTNFERKYRLEGRVFRGMTLVRRAETRES